ncbi:MAG: hypothetical protein ACW99U_12930 [Candidatus Thorarchaeota archaeon]
MKITEAERILGAGHYLERDTIGCTIKLCNMKAVSRVGEHHLCADHLLSLARVASEATSCLAEKRAKAYRGAFGQQMNWAQRYGKRLKTSKCPVKIKGLRHVYPR